LFSEIEFRGEKLEQVITAAEQRLEGPANEVVIQKFVEKETITQQQLEETQAKIEAFEVELPKPE